MRNLLRSTALFAGLALGLSGALAQTAVQQGATRLGAAGQQVSNAPGVNSTQAAGTLTINAVAGQSIYITALYVAACGDGTASTSSIQQNFTTTNLGGIAAANSLVIETSYLSAATITTNAGASQCD